MMQTSSPRSYLQSTGSPSFTQLIKTSTTCIALYKTFHCGNDKLTPTLVGIVSVFQNLRSTLLLPFHSVSSAYLPPPRGTLTGMFNAWVWSLATRKQDTKRNNQSTAETHTSFDMSRKSKSKDQTKALNIPFTLTQRNLLQEALAVTLAKDQSQALNSRSKYPQKVEDAQNSQNGMAVRE